MGMMTGAVPLVMRWRAYHGRGSGRQHHSSGRGLAGIRAAMFTRWLVFLDWNGPSGRPAAARRPEGPSQSRKTIDRTPDAGQTQARAVVVSCVSRADDVNNKLHEPRFVVVSDWMRQAVNDEQQPELEPEPCGTRVLDLRHLSF